MKNKISHIICILFFLMMGKSGFSQMALKKTEHNEYQGSTLVSFLNELSQRDSLHFYYQKIWLNSIKIEFPTKGKTIQNIIDYAIKNSGLTYIKFQKSSIIFIPAGYAIDKNQLEQGMVGYIKVIGNLMDKGKFKENKVEGFVRYGKTLEPIPGAVIQDKKHKLATTSATNGYYSINLPMGETELEFSFIGLETSVVKIDVLSPGKLNMELMEASITLDMVTISSDGGKSKVNRTQIGVEAMDMKSLKKLPVLMGESDIIKSMTLLPGVQSGGEMSSGFYVRGGNVDQNLVLINEAPVYNTSHLFGMFSAFIPGAIDRVELFKGTQSANFGGKVSSVMDISLKKADTTKIKGNAGIGILNSQLFMEGPAIKDFCSFLVGGRTTYSNWMLRNVRDIKIKQSKTLFYDIIGKLDFRIARKHRMEIFGYQSNDYFKYASINEFDYTSQIAGLNYNWSINEQSHLKFYLTYTGFESILSNIDSKTTSSRLINGIKQVRAKTEYGYQIFNHELLTGFEASQFTLNPGKLEPYSTSSARKSDQLDPEEAIELAGFITDNYSISDRISMIAGLRYSWYSKYGPAKAYVYRDQAPINDYSIVDSIVYKQDQWVKPYSGFEPRLGIRIKITNNSSVKMGYSLSRQYQQLITNSSSTTPSDYWKSADTHVKPLICNQYSIGYFSTLFNDFYDISVETYYKETQNQLDYKNGAILTMNHAIEQDLITGFGRSFGFEAMIKKNVGNLTGWLSYTLSYTQMKSQGRFSEEMINHNQFYAASNHHLHDLCLTLNYQLSRRWNMATNFVYTSGRPITFPEMKYIIDGNETVFYSERNKYRLPATHRLDISVTYEGFLNVRKRIHPSFTFAVYNVYAHKNIYSVFYKNDKPSSYNNYHEYGLYKLSIIGIAVPSLTLNLNF